MLIALFCPFYFTLVRKCYLINDCNRHNSLSYLIHNFMNTKSIFVRLVMDSDAEVHHSPINNIVI